MEESERVVREYFAAIPEGPSAQERFYAPDATVEIHGTTPELDKAGVVAYFTETHAAVPDLRMDVVDALGAGDLATIHWRMTGTFAGPGELAGFKPNGARFDVTGVDVVRVRDGQIVRNDAYPDGMTLSRQLGVLPPMGSPLEARMTKLTNVRAPKLGEPEPVADGVWRLSGKGFGGLGDFAVYFVRDGDGVLMFDAGVRQMGPAVAAAAARLGGLTRIVLGHGHTDHRGTAPALGVPVLCHPAEVEDAEGSGGFRYWDPQLRFLPHPIREVHRFLLHPRVDGGPVTISATVEEGDDVAGFRVVHLPGHAPGLIALWRESDRVALSSDAFYVTDMWGKPSPPHLPLDGYNLDTEQARASLRRLAALEPLVACPGHLGPLRGPDVGAQLAQAAATAA
jgi:glyoxylase-like metal-dependent hydrolase (beta-lactamase superfamily II)/ketosteroid isomerase-like protein